MNLIQKFQLILIFPIADLSVRLYSLASDGTKTVESTTSSKILLNLLSAEFQIFINRMNLYRMKEILRKHL